MPTQQDMNRMEKLVEDFRNHKLIVALSQNKFAKWLGNDPALNAVYRSGFQDLDKALVAFPSGSIGEGFRDAGFLGGAVPQEIMKQKHPEVSYPQAQALEGNPLAAARTPPIEPPAQEQGPELGR
ncbi:MAG: hypothetical protein L0Z62_15335 [Gemmataceae bacterium]|nr:hypothetical protein [Gemmataceae bacterium]